MKTNWMLSASLLVLPLALLASPDSFAKSKKSPAPKSAKSTAKKAKKAPKKISISFEEKKPKGRGPAAVTPIEPILEKEVVALETKTGSCTTMQDASGWHLPVEEEASSCTLSGRNKASDPSQGLGFIVNKKFKIFSMTEGEVVGVVGELMGCKVIVSPNRCPAGSKSCDITYTLPNMKKNANNECEIPGIRVGTKLKSCQKIAEVRPSKSFNLVRIETSGRNSLQDMMVSYKKSSSQRKQCSRDKTLLASTLF